MFSEFHSAMLAFFYYGRYIAGKHTSRETSLRGFKSSDRGKANTVFDELVRFGYLVPKPTEYGTQYSLNVQRIDDIKQILNPSGEVKDKPPLEYSLDSRYEQRPFKETEGDHMVKGARAKYRFHRHKFDSSIIVHVVVNGEKKSVIELGSYNDPNSLLCKAVKGIDSKFKGQPFTKADMHLLGKNIVGNRQPPKAIIDMLLHDGYLIQKGKRHHQRTTKELPKPAIDAFRPPDGSS